MERARDNEAQVLTEEYMRQYHSGKIQSDTWYKLYQYSFKLFGKKSLPLVRKALNLPLVKRKSKDGKTIPLERVTLEEVKTSIRNYWPEEEVKQFMGGVDINLRSLTSFTQAETHSREYHAASRRFGGFRKVFDSVYPGLYPRLNQRVLPEELDESSIAQALKDRADAGGDITYVSLYKSGNEEDRKLVRQIMALSKKHFGAEKFVKTVKMLTGMHTKFYPEDVDRQELADIFINRFYAGQPISYSALNRSENPEERDLVKKVMALSRKKSPTLFKTNKPARFYNQYVNTLRRITGLSEADITISPNKMVTVGFLAEEITHFFFQWANLSRLPLPSFVSEGPPAYGRSDATRFFHNGTENYADLRIQEQPIEVKTGFSGFALNPQEFESFIEKYTSGKWASGEPLENCILVFHRRDTPERYAEIMHKKGITFVGYSEFHEWISSLVPEIKSRFSSELTSIQPRCANLDYIVNLHEEVSLRPYMLARRGLTDRLEWSISLMRSLSRRAQELRDGY